MALATQWFSHLHPSEQEAFKSQVRNSTNVLDRLLQIVYNKIQSESSSSVIDYDSPSWAYRQADKAGYLRALNELKEIINVSDQETTRAKT